MKEELRFWLQKGGTKQQMGTSGLQLMVENILADISKFSLCLQNDIINDHVMSHPFFSALHDLFAENYSNRKATLLPYN